MTKVGAEIMEDGSFEHEGEGKEKGSGRRE
jgi:hypothetical protein